MADHAPLWTSKEIADACGGTLVGAPVEARGVTTDSRQTAPGDLFVALKGERDGAAFAKAALCAGAAGVVAETGVEGPAIVVKDALAALTALGARGRERAVGVRLAAITGSVGKTSVTQAVLAGLGRAGAAHGPVHSYNNHIGVPLTLARMPRSTPRAVIEIGMNHAGEIAPLSRLARPQTAAITNVGAVHTENFPDGVAGVAAAKAEIFEGLEGEGCAILPADSPWFSYLAGAATKRGARLRTFGEADGANARLARFAATKDGGAEVSAVIDGERIAFELAQSAAHWGQMSLCVLLVLEALGVERPCVLAALGEFKPLAGRGQESRIALAGGAFTLIDESYNANPLSMVAALASLAARKTKGRRIAALTDMLELGEKADAEHARLAEAIEEGGIDRVFVAGPLMEALWARLPADRRGACAPCADELLTRLAEEIAPGDLVMVKGSKASRAFVLAEGLKALGSGKGRA